MTAEDLAAALTIHSADGQLPDSFAHQNWPNNFGFPADCLRKRPEKCNAYVTDVNGDGEDEVVVLIEPAAVVYSRDTGGKWIDIGRWNLPYNCRPLLDAMRAGNYEMLAPEPSPWRDLSVGGERIPFQPSGGRGRVTCPR